MTHVRYSVTLGYLEAAARNDPVVDRGYQFFRHLVYQEPGKSDEICETITAEIDEPDIVALTIYFWNRALSLNVAGRIKRRWPDCTVIVGGNDVTFQAAQLFAEAPEVDIVVHGEGELRFAAILRALLEGTDLAAIAGISYRGATGVVDTVPASRIANLDDVPSPLLSGVYGLRISPLRA